MNKRFSWLLKMAWRDSRRNRRRLLLFLSSIVLGIAGLVAINSFGESLQKDINRQAKTLLGADLVINSRTLPADSTLNFLTDLGGQQANEANFGSMVLLPQTGDTRLVQVRALEGKFPFYGTLATTPPNAQSQLTAGANALVEQTVMLQYKVAIGDSIKLGEQLFKVVGQLDKAPGQSGIVGMVAPTIFIPKKYLDATKLIQQGSRVQYTYYYQFDQNTDPDELLEENKDLFRQMALRGETVEERKESLSEAFGSLTQFLNLVGFVALLLGCLGVASSVHIYIKDKLKTVAILRCLGASGQQGFLIYLLQIGIMGLLGATIGALLGSFIQSVLPAILKDFIPFEVHLIWSWKAIAQGIFVGFGIAILFALLSLLVIRKVSPLRTLRSVGNSNETANDPLRGLVYGLIALFVVIFAYLQSNSLMVALSFTGAIALSFLLLAGVAKLVMWLVRTYFPVGWSYIWRQSLANLYRPNNQTLILLVCIGLGTALITTLYFVQGLLLGQVQLAGMDNMPNMIVFDIQSTQKEQVAQMAKERQLPIIQEVPIVTMRLAGIDDRSIATIKQDTTKRRRRWALDREYRVSFRDTLNEDVEEVIEGKWVGEVKSPSDSIFISLEADFKKDLKVEIGSKMTFNVQGALVDTYVGSFRKINWQRMQTNFFVLFPKGVLEQAPQYHVLVTRTEDKATSADFQRDIVAAYPNISVVDLDFILTAVDDILSKVSFVIRFMALFSILTGLLVLIGSVIISKYQRIKESVLLHTLGANGRQILMITALEYLFLGSLAALTGVILSLGSSYALAYFSFNMTFVPTFTPMLVTVLAITALTVFIGVFNSREVLNRPPLEILRDEA